MRRFPAAPLAGALLLLAGTLAPATDPGPVLVTVKRVGEPDERVLVKDTEKETHTVTLTDAAGRARKEEKTSERLEVYTETVIEKGERGPAKFRRAYRKAAAAADGMRKDLPYAGRTVVFERKGGKYEASAEGEPPLDRDVLATLARKANDADAELDVILPGKAVKVGDRWPLDTAVLARRLTKAAGLVLDADRSKGEAALTKVYEKDGKRWGVLEVSARLAVKSAAVASHQMTFDPPAALDVRLTLDTVIDGSGSAGTMTLTGKLSGKTTATHKGQQVNIDLTVDSSGTRERSPEK
jgi:hypothetical protein